MPRIAGVKFHKTSTGKKTAVTFNLKIWGEKLQDLLDGIESEAILNNPAEKFHDWDEVKNTIGKKKQSK